MAARRSSRPDTAALDALIAEITADSEDVEEQLSGFADFIGELIGEAVEATVIGESVDLVGVHAGELREGLLATVKRKGKEYVVSALNVEVTVDTELAMYLAAYRRWAGGPTR